MNEQAAERRWVVHLLHYVPEEGPMHSGAMWFWYGVIAMVTPILLILASRWMKKDFRH